jgi:hypothetical protein
LDFFLNVLKSFPEKLKKNLQKCQHDKQHDIFQRRKVFSDLRWRLMSKMDTENQWSITFKIWQHFCIEFFAMSLNFDQPKLIFCQISQNIGSKSDFFCIILGFFDIFYMPSHMAKEHDLCV